MEYIYKLITNIVYTLVVIAFFLPFWYIVCFGVNFMTAKFIITPIIGTQVCLALNTALNTTVFTKDILPVLYATAWLIGSIMFKSHLNVNED